MPHLSRILWSHRQTEPDSSWSVNLPIGINDRLAARRCRRYQRLVVGRIGDRHTEMLGVVAHAVDLGPQSEGVGQMSDSHGARDSAAKLRAGSDVRGSPADDEVCRIHVNAIRGFGDAE